MLASLASSCFFEKNISKSWNYLKWTRLGANWWYIHFYVQMSRQDWQDACSIWCLWREPQLHQLWILYVLQRPRFGDQILLPPLFLASYMSLSQLLHCKNGKNSYFSTLQIILSFRIVLISGMYIVLVYKTFDSIWIWRLCKHHIANQSYISL